MASTSSKIYAIAVGRRKTSAASVRLISGKGEITVNDKPASEYFAGMGVSNKYNLPFEVAGVSQKYAATVRVSGGGTNGQLDAVVLGISRALVVVNDKFKAPLRASGFLTRDPRERQRRQVGKGGKSRRQKQSPKR